MTAYRMSFPTTTVAAAVLGASISWTSPPNDTVVAADRVLVSTGSSLGPLFSDPTVVRQDWYTLARSTFPNARGLTREEGEAYESILEDLFR